VRQVQEELQNARHVPGAEHAHGTSVDDGVRVHHHGRFVHGCRRQLRRQATDAAHGTVATVRRQEDVQFQDAGVFGVQANEQDQKLLSGEAQAQAPALVHGVRVAVRLGQRGAAHRGGGGVQTGPLLPRSQRIAGGIRPRRSGGGYHQTKCNRRDAAHGHQSFHSESRRARKGEENGRGGGGRFEIGDH